jgi:hypothetical protein
MIRRPSLRSTVTTVAAAALLAGGASLASYAATSHGPGTGGGAATSSEPKTLKFTLGSPGKIYHGNTDHLFTAKVPKGAYQIGMSGLVLDNTGSDSDSYTCLIADQKNIEHVLGGGHPNYALWYALDGDRKGAFKYGVVNYSNSAQRIARPNIVFGCIFDGTGPFTVARTLTFTLRPVKVTAEKGKPLPVAKSQARRLAGKLH